ncbi:MAG TPA: hypothetical protein VN673_10625 [Clostridia bacterium]|nr:hypothetical protein [Clostridia bacterium]
MKRFFFLPILAIPLLVAGCASYSGGSAADDYDGDFEDGYSNTSLGPQLNTFQAPGSGTTASPTFRSGLHPQDIRDPSALMWPRPYRGMR